VKIFSEVRFSSARRWLCRVVLSLFLFVMAGGCQPSADEASPPLGRWEFLGQLPDGREAVVRAEIVEGPFLRYLGFHAPGVPVSRETLAEVKENAEAFWSRAPEMLVQFDGENFLWRGGDFDGQMLLQVTPDGLISHRADTPGVLLSPVQEFSPLHFPLYEQNLLSEGP
jgi:hypothetical protein